MDQLPYRAVIVDLDRTLLRTDKSVSEYTLNVLKNWQASGARMFAATARPERAIASYREMIGFDAVTTLNGARTITPEAVFEEPVSRSGAELVLKQWCAVSGMVVSVETEDGLYANTDIPVWTPTVVGDLRTLPREKKIYKILASHPDISPDRIALVLPDDAYSTIVDRKLVQVMARTATKWNGVRRMLDACGIDPAQAVFFGDDNDDIEPIRRCGCGVAVANALEQVREAADYVTKSNDEDGVAVFLAGLI